MLLLPVRGAEKIPRVTDTYKNHQNKHKRMMCHQWEEIYVFWHTKKNQRHKSREIKQQQSFNPCHTGNIKGQDPKERDKDDWQKHKTHEWEKIDNAVVDGAATAICKYVKYPWIGKNPYSGK